VTSRTSGNFPAAPSTQKNLETRKPGRNQETKINQAATDAKPRKQDDFRHPSGWLIRGEAA
jgi:hypothetical protein